MRRSDEEILVVRREQLLPPAGLHGFVAGPVDAYEECVRRAGEFRPRVEVEDDPSLKQVIPYLIVRHDARIFLFQRLRRGGEGRLRGLYSIGVGGHIARPDAERVDDPLGAALVRELEEELMIPGAWRRRPVGILNDDETPVGRVHFGIVYVVDAEESGIRVREVDRLRGHLATPREVQGARPRMETWSQLVLDRADPFSL